MKTEGEEEGKRKGYEKEVSFDETLESNQVPYGSTDFSPSLPSSSSSIRGSPTSGDTLKTLVGLRKLG